MILDSNPERWNSSVHGEPVRGGDALWTDLREKGIAGLRPFTAIHPRAIVAEHTTIGAGTQIFAAAVVNSALCWRKMTSPEPSLSTTRGSRRMPAWPSVACLLGECVENGAGSVVLPGLRIGAVVTNAVAPGRTADGFHGSERTYLRLLIAMLEQGSCLNAYTDLPRLRAALAESKTHTSLFPERL